MTNDLQLECTERKFEVKAPTQALPELIKRIGAFIPLHQYVPGQMITHNHTIYFDNEGCFLLKQGLENRFDSARVRARKYEYNNATDALDYYWLELKQQGDTRTKERLRLTSSDLRGLLHGLPVTPRVCEQNSSLLSDEACGALYEELQGIVEENALTPILLASYQRVAFENATARLSIDWNVRYRIAGRFLFGYPSLKDIPHAPAGKDDAVVMELRYTGESSVLIEALHRNFPILPLASFSKRDRGMQALLQGPLNARPDASDLLQRMHEHDRATAARPNGKGSSAREMSPQMNYV